MDKRNTAFQALPSNAWSLGSVLRSALYLRSSIKVLLQYLAVCEKLSAAQSHPCSLTLSWAAPGMSKYECTGDTCGRTGQRMLLLARGSALMQKLILNPLLCSRCPDHGAVYEYTQQNAQQQGAIE